MATTPDKPEILRNQVLSTIGDPMVSSVGREEGAYDRALSNGLVDYWLSFPFEYMDTMDITNFSTFKYERKIPDLRLQAFLGQDDDAVASTYYLGVCRVSETALPFSYSNINSYLLNVPFGSSPFSGGSSGYGMDVVTGPLDVRKMELQATEQAYLTGNTEINIDRVHDKVVFTVPTFFGQIVVWHGFGSTDNTLKFVPWNHMRILGDFVTVKYLTSIIAARSTVSVQSDYSLNVDFLKELRSEAQDRLQTALTALQIVPLMWS